MAVPIRIENVVRELPDGPPPRRRVLTELARAEARRNLRSPWLWCGIAASAWVGRLMLTADYQAGTYQGAMAAFSGVAAAVFVLGAIAGSRDRGTTSATGLPLSEESVVTTDERTIARLLGLLPVVAVGTLYVIAVFVASRIEGGFWVGDVPGRSDTAQHGLFEALQPVVLFLTAGAAGVAIGRTRTPRPLAYILGVLVLVMAGFLYWAWQGDGVVYVSLVQTQPFEVDITEVGQSIDFDSVPDDWLLSAPDPYDKRWAHLVFDQRVAAAHDLYLLGLAALAAGLAVRGRNGRLLAAAGGLAAVAGVVAQIALFPGS